MGIRAMVVEDDAFTRTTVTAALRQYGVEVVADCGNAKDALALFRVHRPAVCVLDLDLGRGPTGVDVATAMRRLDSVVGLVILTTYEDPRLLSSSLGFMPQGSRYAVKGAVSDMTVLLAAIESAAEHPRRNGMNATGTDLTDTQVETLRLVAMGLSNAEIARIRVVEERTVEQSIRRIAKRLGVKTGSNVNQRVALARLYYKRAGTGAIHTADAVPR